MIRHLGSLRVLEMRSPSEEPETTGYDFIRYEMPPDSPLVFQKLLPAGFFFGDRTLGVSISLNAPERQKQKSRMPVERIAWTEEIARLAKKSFETDRRFDLKRSPDSILSAKMIDSYLEDCSDGIVLGTHFHGVLAGFLILKPSEEKGNDFFIYLAAALPEYRLCGTALSLYLSACREAEAAGCRTLSGRISARNMPVMNLYSSLGGRFSDPLDIYLKENAR